MSDAFYKKLHELNYKTGEDYSYEDGENGRSKEVVYHGKIDSNFPWLYIDFQIEGGIDISTLAAIELRYQAFAAVEGGQVESITVFPVKRLEAHNGVAMDMRIKMVYVPAKENPAQEPSWRGSKFDPERQP